jgi:pimeloyl-ACP methyl ester carboxylesterase
LFLGSSFLRPEILKQIIFTKDQFGNPLSSPDTVLICAGYSPNYITSQVMVKSFVRNDVNGTWGESQIVQGSFPAGENYSIRDIEIYIDQQTGLNYDIFILDYRSYGKSEGEIKSQAQLFEDNQIVYEKLKKEYEEENIIILGYSIGTGMASNLASKNDTKQLILQAPYYSLTDMMRHRFSFIPTFILKYKFATNEYLKDCKMPITIFHGNQDGVINYESSTKLKEDFTQIEIFTLDGQGHSGMTDNLNYKREIKNVLEK